MGGDFRHKARHAVRSCVAPFRDRTILGLSVLLGIAVAGLLWHQAHQRARLVESTAVQQAARYAEAVAVFRTLYTSEVVKPMTDHGIKATHDYRDIKGTIPLPATLSMLLGNRLAEKEAGGHTRLYSPYPFPWRSETGGLRDDFAREAWKALRQRPEEPYYRFEDIDGRVSLRYATADVMRSSCVRCHNSHPDTPKREWKEGDMRGVLEIMVPLDTTIAQTHADLWESLFVITSIFMVGLACIGLVITRLRRTSIELEQRVAERTQEAQDRAGMLARTNAELEHTVAELREFNELAEGRELRMIELKTEINSLADRLGEPQRYDVSLGGDEPCAVERESTQHG